MEANALGAPVVINIPAGTYQLTRTSPVDEQGGDLDLTSNVTLRGAGADQTILDGNGADRVLQVYWDRTVTVEGVTVRNGRTTEWGGGIYNVGTLSLTGSTVSGNTAERSGDGGGIYNLGTLSLTSSTASGNTARRGGGGIFNYGTLTLTNSTVTGNIASDAFGDGGGILNTGTLTLTNSTVSGNTARRGGGGIYNADVASLSFSTITRNTSHASAGGGILVEQGNLTLKGVILAGNTSESGIGPECSGSLISQGYNLIKSNADCQVIPQSTDILNQDPRLGLLADNGGPTQTHLPQAGSPVLDKVPASACTDLDGAPLSTDQRGTTRPQGRACDIGSVER